LVPKLSQKIMEESGGGLTIMDLDNIANGVNFVKKFSKVLDDTAKIYGVSIGKDVQALHATDIPIQRKLDLDKFAHDNCEVRDGVLSEYHNSIICSLYRFSKISLLISQMQFTVADDPSKHVLKLMGNFLTDIFKNMNSKAVNFVGSQSDWIIKGISSVKKIDDKIDNKEAISWSDINDVLNTSIIPFFGNFNLETLAYNLDAVNKYINPIAQQKGIKIAPVERIDKYKI